MFLNQFVEIDFLVCQNLRCVASKKMVGTTVLMERAEKNFSFAMQMKRSGVGRSSVYMYRKALLCIRAITSISAKSIDLCEFNLLLTNTINYF